MGTFVNAICKDGEARSGKVIFMDGSKWTLLCHDDVCRIINEKDVITKICF